LAKVEPLLAIVGNWGEFLSLSDEEELKLLRRHERSGRPLGNDNFVDRIEAELTRMLRPLKRGPKQKPGN
jgi:putative transposase